jgi:hypothetical protein
VVNSQGSYLFPHNLEMMRMIIQYFIRSAWILEGFNNQGDNQGGRRGANLDTLVNLAKTVFEASTQESFYLIPEQDSRRYIQQRVTKDDQVTLIHFLMRRLTIDNRGPNHPTGYDIAFYQTDLFKPQIFGKILALPLTGDGVDQYNNSRLKNVFIQQIATFCYSDPSQIPKMIKDGTLAQVADVLRG